MPTLAQRYDPAFPIDELLEHPDNPRRGDEEAIEASMAAHGFYGAVLAQTSTRRIIAGNHRTRVARRRGEATVPVLWLDVDDDQARRLLLVDNRTSDDARYDDRVLTDLLAELAAAGDLTGTGWDPTDLARLLKRWDTPGDPDAIPPEPAVPITRTGDLWILGTHRLLCGDSTNRDDVARLLEGITPRLMVTDPPYLINYTSRNHPASKTNGGIPGKDWDAYVDPATSIAFYRDFLALALEHLTPTAPIYQWHASRRQLLVDEAWQANGLLWHQTVYWVKTRPTLTRSDFMWALEPCAYGWREGHRPRLERRPPNTMANVWELASGGVNAEHPTIKPVRLYTDPYTWHLRAGEWAYEPFSGSGTAIAAAEITVDYDGDEPVDDDEPHTAAAGAAITAAEVTHRRCAAMEQAPTFVDVACARWQQLTGRLPVLEASGEPHSFIT